MIKVEGGTLKLGGKIYQINSLLVDNHEVTMGEFEEFVKATSYVTTAELTGGARIWRNKQWSQSKEANWRHDLYGNPYPKDKYKILPVSNISFDDAKAYASWANQRLPTVAEWVFLARGGNLGKRTRYAGSNKVDKVAWYDENTLEKKQPVCQKKPNELGLYDMSGNVLEIVVDESGQPYARGGCYFSNQEFCEINDNGWKVKQDEVFHTYGFRCVRNQN